MLCLGLSLSLHAQKKYEKEWKEISTSQEKGLPATVITLTEKIYKEADAEKNFPQQLRAFVTRMNARMQIDTDSFYTDFAALQQWKMQVTDSVQQSILAQVIADKTVEYIQRDLFSIRQKKETSDPLEQDIRKWTSAQFRTQCLALIEEALATPKSLSLVPGNTFKGLITLENASRYFLHDMYHVSGFHSIEVIKNLQRFGFLTFPEATKRQETIYSEMINFYTENGNRSAVLLLNLERLQDQLNAQVIVDSIYRLRLDELIQENQDLDVSVEAYLKKATSLRNSGKYTEAISLLDQLSNRYTRYDRIEALKELRNQIVQPTLTVEMAQIAYPGERIAVKVTHKNIERFTLRFYPVSLEPEQKEFNKLREKNFLKEHGGTPFNREFSLDPPKDFHEKDTTFYFEAPTHGIYVAEVISTLKKESPERLVLHVSSLKVLTRKQIGDRQTDLVVLDRKTGNPVPDAQLSVYSNQKGEYIFHKTLTTDSKGKCELNETGNTFQIYAKKDKDTSLPGLYVYNYSNVFLSDESAASETVQLLTDRSLYRPGQSVFVKGIAYQKQGDNTQVISSRSFDLILYDANNKEVSKTTLVSNEWGSFTHTFTLPVRTLSGNFRIQCGNYSTSIRVEEYKRPTFEIQIDTLQSAIQLGETASITGKAMTFSGFPLQNDSVSYTIIREPRYPWRWSGTYAQPIASGTTRTDEAGQFTFSFNLDAPNLDSREELAFRFRIQVDVTESSGETQRGENTLIAGNRSMVIFCELPSEICRDSVLEVTPRAESLNGVAVPAELEVQLFRKGQNQSVWQGTLTANKKITIRELSELPSGEYSVQLTTRDAQGRLCKWEQEFTLFSMHDTRPPVRKPIWTKQMHTIFPENGVAEILFATAEKDVYLLYDLFAERKLIESRRIILSDTLVHFRLPYLEEYGDGISLTLCFVKDGKLYQESFTIQKPLPQKNLVLKWEVFRDKLQPGQQEEWRLTIKDPNGNPSQAELMASLYDASLDQIYPFNPQFAIDYSRYIPGSSWNTDNEYSPGVYIAFPIKTLKYPGWAYDHWDLRANFSVKQGILTGRIAGYSGTVKRALATNINTQGINNPPALLKADRIDNDFDNAVLEEIAVHSTDGSAPEIPSQIRENFNETAFFYPQLYTNENGEISISFTLPESLTKWRFTGIAHTKDVQTGRLQGDITTSKPFMLTANLPRYLRQGDVTGIAASLRNNSGTWIQGQARCELFDPYTDKILQTLHQTFRIESDSTLALFFEPAPLKGYELVGIRMIADGGTFSDGEQHVLPLLSDKVYLIETIPLSQRGSGSKEYSLSSLFNAQSATATDRKLTVEITANPTWLAVQALPYLNNPTRENAISYVTAYYANTLSGWIVNQNPTLKTALEMWKTAPSPVQSNLQRNTDLKEMLLEETPWVAASQNEAERRARLVTLTDVNTLNYQRNEALEKLQDLQLADGSFPWFNGMRGSTSITSYILELLGRIPQLTDPDEDPLSQSIRTNAYTFLHKEMETYYNQLTDKNNYILSEWELNYLYLCTLSPEPVPSTSQKAYDFYLQALPQALTHLSLRGRATAVLVLLHHNRTQEADAFYRSLKEHAVGNEEMGLYYANTGLFDETYTLTRAIEAAWAMNDQAFADEMKLNLLRRKQTQMWDSPVSTSNAVYVLLKENAQLTTQPGETTVTIGPQTVHSSPKAGDADALMGYTKVSFTGPETQESKATFTHTGTGISWGAIYGESMEQINHVQEHGTQVSVQKELFVRRQTHQPAQGGISWEKITANTVLSRGDQVMTRLTVTADRPMDFVTLKDQRASCLEPVRQLSGYQAGGYFVSEKDASSNLFFDRLPQGTHTFELESYVARSGNYTTGIATLQSAYASEFSGHSASSTLTVK